MSNPAGWLSVCETGGCLEILVKGDTVVLRETSTPDDEVVTPLASWQAWQDKARDQERAAIVGWLRSETGVGQLDLDPGAGWGYAALAMAVAIERGEHADVVTAS